MQRTEESWFSPNLRREMRFRTYGDRGRPMIVFPAQEGHFPEFEDFGMVDAIREFIEDGRIRLFCLDSVDSEAWCNNAISPHDRSFRANEFDRYVIEEMVPHIRRQSNDGQGGILSTGCSMGAYHAANMYFRHPDVLSGCIALSGVYDLTLFIGDAMDDAIYYHVPLAYLPNLSDPLTLDHMRRGDIVLCVGQGAWEEPMLTHTRHMDKILRDKNIPAWIDIWGHDVSHDWPWWRKQLPHFLQTIAKASAPVGRP